MAGFLLRRLLLGLVVLFVASSATFCFFASKYFPLKTEPLAHAYWTWLRGIPTGHSLSRGVGHEALWPVVGPAIAHTLALLACTFVLVVVFALLFGCLAAAVRGSALDVSLRGISYAAWSMPAFLLALVLQQTLGNFPGGYGLGWFPFAGWPGTCTPTFGVAGFQCNSHFHVSDIPAILHALTLPSIALALGYVGLHSRYLRSSLVDVLDAPFITVARAKGLPERNVVLRHALRNSLVTVAPVAFSDFGAIFGASLAVDYVFQLNGIGSVFINVLAVNSTSASIEAYLAELLLLVGGVFVLLASILSEVLLRLLDPRVRLQ
jgi:ABC-type dipeptide/oligopeptide/nickel transport system permease component